MLFFFGMRHQRIVMEKRPLEKCSPQSKENLASVPINGEAARTKHSRQIFAQREKSEIMNMTPKFGPWPLSRFEGKNPCTNIAHLSLQIGDEPKGKAGEKWPIELKSQT